MSQIFLGHKQTLSLTHGLKLLHLHSNIRTQTLKQTLAHGDTNIVDTDTCALTHSTLVLVLGHIHKTTLIHITHTLTHGHGHNKKRRHTDRGHRRMYRDEIYLPLAAHNTALSERNVITVFPPLTALSHIRNNLARSTVIILNIHGHVSALASHVDQLEEVSDVTWYPWRPMRWCAYIGCI